MRKSLQGLRALSGSRRAPLRPSMRYLGIATVISVCSIGVAAAQTAAEQPAGNAATWSVHFGSDRDPILPRWLRFGGQYRTRFENQDGIKYTRTSDFYILSQFRFNLAIRPVNWLTLFGETQDSRVF